MEFSGALQDALRALGVRALTADLRLSETGGMHYQGDVRDIISLTRWEAIFFFPNCFQQLRADDCLKEKMADGRTFWGCAMVLWCLCCTASDIVVVEQPDTIVYDYFTPFGVVLHEFRTTLFGDVTDKFVRLGVRGLAPDQLDPRDAAVRRRRVLNSRPPSQFKYPCADARDRSRSSWRIHPKTCTAIASLLQRDRVITPSDYSTAIWRFAAAWHEAGRIVPQDFDADDGRPPDPQRRQYQYERGPGIMRAAAQTHRVHELQSWIERAIVPSSQKTPQTLSVTDAKLSPARGTELMAVEPNSPPRFREVLVSFSETDQFFEAPTAGTDADSEGTAWETASESEGDEQAQERDADFPEEEGFGGADPHGTGDYPVRAPRKRRMSFRQCKQAEERSVLAAEPFSDCMPPLPTQFFIPERSPVEDPLPRSPEEYFTASYLHGYRSDIRSIQRATQKSASGTPASWQSARSLRFSPVAHAIEEEVQEAFRHLPRMDFTDCLKGGAPKLLQPTRWPEDPPSTHLKVAEIIRRAGTEGAQDSTYGEVYPDQQVIAYMAHGFQLHSLAQRVAHRSPMHVGALKEPLVLEKALAKDEAKGFVHGGFTKYPPFSQARFLPYNVVVRKGKGRLTIDPGFAPTAGVDPPNLVDNDYEAAVRYVRVSEFCRSLAIGKAFTQGPWHTWGMDGESFYCVHPLQRMDRPNLCLLLPSGGRYFVRPPFGPSQFPLDIGCRAASFYLWVSRRELKAFDSAHPPRHKAALEGLAARRALRKQLAPHLTEETDFEWAVLFTMYEMIDDVMAGSYADVIYENDEMVMWTPPGSVTQVPKLRPDFHWEIHAGVMEALGVPRSVDKDQRPHIHGLRIICIGYEIRTAANQRRIDPERSLVYAQCVEGALAQSLTPFAEANSLFHKLINASECEEDGRQNIFHIARCLKVHFLVRGCVRWNVKAKRELEWWLTRLRNVKREGLPLASKQAENFGLCHSVLVLYGDSSREDAAEAKRQVALHGPEAPPLPSFSGYGAWTKRGRLVPYIVGRWSTWEIAHLIIAVSETLTTAWATRVFTEYFGPEMTHVLRFTDNEVTEAITNASLSKSRVLHEIVQEDKDFCRAAGLLQSSARITSIANKWADALSRGDEEWFLAEVRARGWKPARLDVPPEWRNTQKYEEVLQEEFVEKALIRAKPATALGKHNPMMDENRRNPRLHLRLRGGGVTDGDIIVSDNVGSATIDGWEQPPQSSYQQLRAHVRTRSNQGGSWAFTVKTTRGAIAIRVVSALADAIATWFVAGKIASSGMSTLLTAAFRSTATSGIGPQTTRPEDSLVVSFQGIRV
jgi:hypothetical protein